MDVEPRSTEELVAGWWLFGRLRSGTREDRKRLEAGEPIAAQAGFDGVDSRIEAGGIAAIDLILALLEAADQDGDVELVAAGPLDDLLALHAATLAPHLVQALRQNPILARAMLSVWTDADEFDAATASALRPWLKRR
jgi:hypothetical protein